MKFTGTVVKGDQVGRTFGFPTANLEAPNNLKPGVYSGYVDFDGGAYRSAIVISPARAGKVIEAHLINFDEDLYGKEVTIRVEDFLRGWMEFENSAEGQRRIAQDIKIINERL